MTQTAYPEVGSSTTDDQWRDLSRLLADTGAMDATSFAPSAGTGMQVKAAAGLAFVDGIVARSSAEETLSVTAAPGGSLYRIDTLVEQLDYTHDPICYLKVLPGTPAASGAQAPPSLAPAGAVKYNWPICDLAIGPSTSSITGGMITDRRTFTGTNVGYWANNAGRPTSPRLRQLGFNIASGKWEYYDGTWKVLSIAWDDVTGKPSTFPPDTRDALTINGRILTAGTTFPGGAPAGQLHVLTTHA